MKKTHPEIRTFILQYVSGRLKTSADQVAIDEPLVNLGLSSREAVVLTAELENFLNRPVDPAAPWEHPTIDRLAEHLASLA